MIDLIKKDQRVKRIILDAPGSDGKKLFNDEGALNKFIKKCKLFVKKCKPFVKKH